MVPRFFSEMQVEKFTLSLLRFLRLVDDFFQPDLLTNLHTIIINPIKVLQFDPIDLFSSPVSLAQLDFSSKAQHDHTGTKFSEATKKRNRGFKMALYRRGQAELVVTSGYGVWHDDMKRYVMERGVANIAKMVPRFFWNGGRKIHCITTNV